MVGVKSRTLAESLRDWRVLGGTRDRSLVLEGSGGPVGTMPHSVLLKRGSCAVGSSLGDSGTFCTVSEGPVDPRASIAGAGA